MREPVPGGGSAAALAGAMGAALLGMAARYSLRKGKCEQVEKDIEGFIVIVDAARLKFIEWTGRDAQAYLDVVHTRKSGDKEAYRLAQIEASHVPGDIIAACKECLALTPLLYREGNPHLLSDVKAAEAFLKAGIDAANYMQEANA
ncbi:MAG: cyclodeaminase/cyclohydrolase family protein [Candidatus Omnitrophica bacterium]|nr:cyclodeaminase/cyclohydrolase family protein [Candidatus Omnitrophota bacterium]